MRKARLLILVSTMVLAICGAAIGQTSSFSYQGKLTDGGAPANGSFEMRFRLYNIPTGGTQIGSTIDNVPISAAGGIFSVKLDFGTGVFPAATTRYLEIAVRHNSGESYVILAPREQLVSVPYAIQTIRAQQADLVVGQTDNNTPNTVVQRDAAGTFRVGAIAVETNRGASVNGFGFVWRDSQIAAWAKVDAAGAVSSELGVTSITHAATGSYEITINAKAADAFSLIPFAVAEIDAQPVNANAVRIVSINQSSVNQFQVYINNGTGSPVDNDFVFVVTGR